MASLTKTGALPSGVSFLNNGDGTAKIAGTPAAGSAGNYPITITAANGVMPNATQISITLGNAAHSLHDSYADTHTQLPRRRQSTPTPTPTPTSHIPTQLLNISTRLFTRQEKMLRSAGSSSRAVI